ncbi:PaaI family thioesterase [Mesobacillus harenae]|uniref:PaaI family thioesterase n=1 Tax=Mesobacillus harenae TaxID=2213203 RepID=UPI00157FF8E8|nr:PaaI family thioesterase [Mesobacillus harenae]
MSLESIDDMRKIYESSPFNNFVGIKLKKFEEGAVVYSIKIKPNHLNVNQAVHGGVYFTILDSVMGATIRSVTKEPITTINTTINYFASLKDGDEMIASAKVVQRGRSIVTAEAEVTDRNGTVLAKTVGTFKILKQRY